MLTFVFCVVQSASATSDWPQFRGPGGQGYSGETDLAESWDESTNVDWRVELPGAGSSSPIALGDKLYITTYSGYGTADPDGEMEDLRLHLLCIEQETGDIIWDEEIAPVLPETDAVRDHGYAGPTPATDGESLYVFFGKSGVFRFDLEGNQIWNTRVGDGLHEWGCGTSPVLFEDLVIVNASVESRSLVGLRKSDGEEVWRAEGMRASWNTPHLVELPNGSTELAVSVHSRILGFDPATGESLWTCDGIEDYICPSIVSRDGILYAIGGRQSRTLAIRAGGRGDVTDSHRLWDARVGANVTSPVIVNDYLYWVSDRNSVAYCIRLEDGEVMYQERFPSQPYASAMAADGKIYVVTRRGGTYVLSAEPEYRQLAHNNIEDGSQFNASPIVAGGRIYLRSDRYLYAIGNKP